MSPREPIHQDATTIASAFESWYRQGRRARDDSIMETKQVWTLNANISEASQAHIPFELLSERWQTYLKLIYMVTAGTSIILNVMTVIVLYRGRRSGLRGYLINLSISDLLMSVLSIPFTYSEFMLRQWIWPAPLCPVVRFVVTLSVFESSATMFVIGLNRYLALMHPMRKKKEWKKYELWTHKSYVIIGLWTIGIAISSPEYFMHQVVGYHYDNNRYYICEEKWSKSISDTYTIFIYASTFFIPLIGLSYLYGSIGLMLSRRHLPGNVDLNRDQMVHTKRVKVINMLTVVVVLYAGSWLPMQTFTLVNFLLPDMRKDIEVDSLKYNIYTGIYFAFHWMSMAHSCINPLIYCFMNDNFRSDLKKIFFRRRNQNHAYSAKKIHQYHTASQQHHSSHPNWSGRSQGSIGSLQSTRQAAANGGDQPTSVDQHQLRRISPSISPAVEPRDGAVAYEEQSLSANNCRIAASQAKAIDELGCRRPLGRPIVVKLSDASGKHQSHVPVGGHQVETDCGSGRHPDIEELDEPDDEDLIAKQENFACQLVVANCTNYSADATQKQIVPKVPLRATSSLAERASRDNRQVPGASLMRHSVTGGVEIFDGFVYV